MSSSSLSKSGGNAGRYNNSTLARMIFMNKKLFDTIKPLVEGVATNQDDDESKDTDEENLTALLSNIEPFKNNEKNTFRELNDFERFLKYKDLIF